MEKVIAVVVTHNHYSDLITCIKAIRNQTHQPDAILVVNNGSTDFTSVWLDQQTDIIHLYQDNLGSAGGFSNGISWAYQEGYDWIWCMDDKGFPKNDALENLINSQGMNTELLSSIMVDKQDQKTILRKTKKYKTTDQIQEPFVQNGSYLFNGSLIHRNIVSKVGLPHAHLFEQGVESEYYYRITKKYNFSAKTILNSEHYQSKVKSFFKNEWDLKSDYEVFYFLRNKLTVLKSKYGNVVIAFFAYLVFIFNFCVSILVNQKTNKIRKLSFVFWPMKDALKNNRHLTPMSISKKMQEQYSNHFSGIIFKPLRKFCCNIFVPSLKETSTPITI